jgi:hypothetical protein
LECLSIRDLRSCAACPSQRPSPEPLVNSDRRSSGGSADFPGLRSLGEVGSRPPARSTPSFSWPAAGSPVRLPSRPLPVLSATSAPPGPALRSTCPTKLS